MIQYSFFTQMRLPAPFVWLALRHPHTGTELCDVAAQIDTATDRTLLPLELVNDLASEQFSEIEIEGVGGNVEWMPLFDVLLGVATLPLRRYEVVAHADEPWILLGRDVRTGIESCSIART